MAETKTEILEELIGTHRRTGQSEINLLLEHLQDFADGDDEDWDLDLVDSSLAVIEEAAAGMRNRLARLRGVRPTEEVSRATCIDLALSLKIVYCPADQKVRLVHKNKDVCELTPQLLNGLEQIQDVRAKMEKVIYYLRSPDDTTSINSKQGAATELCQALNMIGWNEIT